MAWPIGEQGTTDYNGEFPQFPKSARTDLACPYFMPVEKLENGSWPHPSRLPLGCGWRGHCTAPAHEGEEPPQTVLEAFCNLGYASGCEWAPCDRPWDAVRFAIAAPPTGSQDSRNDAASVIRVLYVCERDHRPAAQGGLEFDLQQSVWRRSHADPRLQRMAQCFLQSYMRQKH